MITNAIRWRNASHSPAHYVIGGKSRNSDKKPNWKGKFSGTYGTRNANKGCDEICKTVLKFKLNTKTIKNRKNRYNELVKIISLHINMHIKNVNSNTFTAFLNSKDTFSLFFLHFFFVFLEKRIQDVFSSCTVPFNHLILLF